MQMICIRVCCCTQQSLTTEVADKSVLLYLSSLLVFFCDTYTINRKNVALFPAEGMVDI